MTTLAHLDTPAALIDLRQMQANIDRMQARMNRLGVAFRPHVKTSKCTPVARAQQAAGAKGITVSTLKEAHAFFAEGFNDILYAVGMVQAKLPQALALRRQGCQLKIITDSEASSAAIVAFGREHGEVFEVWLEIDSDGHRSGLKPDEPALLTVARTLHQGGMRLGGVMTHAGSSYELNTPEALTAMAAQERDACLLAAERLSSTYLGTAILGGILLASWDLFLDPQMVGEGYWTWADTGWELPGIPGIPLQNFLGWLLASVVLMASLSRLPRKVARDGVPTMMLIWIYASNVFAALVFFGKPGVAIWGLVCMGVVMVPWMWRIWSEPQW